MTHKYAIYRLDDWSPAIRDCPKTLIRGGIDAWEDALMTASLFERTKPDEVFVVLNHYQ